MSAAVKAAAIEGFIDEYPGDLPVLIVDDEVDVRSVISRCLRKLNLRVAESQTLSHARNRLESGQKFSMVFLDRCLPDGDGVDFLREILEWMPKLTVAIITGMGDSSNAEAALDIGAFAYLPKPCRIGEIRNVVFRRYPTLSDSFRNGGTVGPVIDGSLGRESDSKVVLVAHSPQMINVTLEVRNIAKMKGSVLVMGPSGSGKEVIARKIHQGSERSSKAFVAVNCGAIPEDLIESELFGHEKGSFTGAITDRKGFFEEADGGTIFLDEITETSPGFQVKVLRVLQEHQITRVGSSQEIELDVRVIASTNRDLSQAVASGAFREDLYYRLNCSEISLPALKDRREDIEPLAFHFAHATVRKTGRPVLFSKGAMMALQAYDWPGNVRELQSAVDSAVQGCNKMVLMGDLPKALRFRPAELKSDETSVVQGSSPLLTLAEATDLYILEVLRRCGGNQSRAAEILNIHRRTVLLKSRKNGWNKEFGGEWKCVD